MTSRGNGSRHVSPVPFLIAAMVLALLGIVLAGVAWPHLKSVDAYPLPGLPLAGTVYAALGTLIVIRVRNRIGWLLIGEGAGLALICVTSAYAVIGVAHPGLWPIPKVVGASSEWLFVPVVMGLAFMFLIFPTGRLPSPRWRPVAIATAVATAITLVAFILTPRQIGLPAPGGVSLRYPNPFGIPGLRNDVLGTVPGLGVVTAFAFVAAAAALVVRYRSGEPELRQQIKWVAFAAGAEVAFQVALTISLVTAGNDATVTTVIGLASALLALLGIPIAITIAILRHGLYQIDVIINRTVVYGLLAAAVTGVYIVIVAGIGALAGYGGGPLLTVAAAVVIAVLFQPLRRRAQRVANRVVYGERATPYQVLSEFADAMARTCRSRSSSTGWCRCSRAGREPLRWRSGPGSARRSGPPRSGSRRAPAPATHRGRRRRSVGVRRCHRGVPGAAGRRNPGGGRPPQAEERAAVAHRDGVGAARRIPGCARRPQRPTQRRAAQHDRRAARVTSSARRGAGLGAAEDRAEPARRRATAARRARRPARAPRSVRSRCARGGERHRRDPGTPADAP